MRFGEYRFGAIDIDGITYTHDIVIDHSVIGKRKKKQSKRHRNAFGHTPLSLEEDIPWNCQRLVIGTGLHGAMPVMNEVKAEAERRMVELVILPTAEAIGKLKTGLHKTNAILHLTC